MDVKYKKILPEDVFISYFEEEEGEIELWTGVKFESGNRATGNDFINLFADLIRRHGNRPALFYARLMGVEPNLFNAAIMALSGIGAKEWINRYMDMVCCEVLEKTNWPLTKVAKVLQFSSLSNFGQFFRHMHRCSPYEWRYLKQHGVKEKYHYE
jgi:AraC-like DNA-binding protein